MLKNKSLTTETLADEPLVTAEYHLDVENISRQRPYRATQTKTVIAHHVDDSCYRLSGLKLSIGI